MATFNKHGVEITPNMIKVGASSYPLNNISGLHVRTQRADHSVSYALWGTAGVAFPFGVAVLGSGAIAAGLIMMLASAAAIVIGKLLYDRRYAVHRLYFVTSAGQLDAFSHRDLEAVREVADAASSAIETRG